MRGHVPLITLHNAALESKWWGESPKLLQEVFQEARRIAPCVVFIDEIDGMGRARSDQDQNCVYSFKCELFRNMDSLADVPVVVVACTNCPGSLDPALRRRFQRKIEVLPPSHSDRMAILALLPDVPESLVTEIANRTHGFTGADLTALYEAARGGSVARCVRRESSERARCHGRGATSWSTYHVPRRDGGDANLACSYGGGYRVDMKLFFYTKRSRSHTSFTFVGATPSGSGPASASPPES